MISQYFFLFVLLHAFISASGNPLIIWLKLSQQCRDDLKTVNQQRETDQGQLQLMEALDAWGKPSGILQGTFTDTGDFSQCRKLVSANHCDTEANCTGRVSFNYVLLEGSLKVQNLSLASTLGVCVPQKCETKADVTLLMKMIFDRIADMINDHGGEDDDDAELKTFKKRLSHTVKSKSEVEQFVDQAAGLWVGSLALIKTTEHPHVSITYALDRIFPSRDAPITVGAAILFAFLSVLGLIILLSTTIDYHASFKKRHGQIRILEKGWDSSETASMAQEEENCQFDNEDQRTLLPTFKEPPEPSIWRKILSCFSLYQTLPAMLSTKRSESMQNLALLDPIRVVSMWWVAAAHTLPWVMIKIPGMNVNVTQVLH
jgi:hypothetical protein